MYMKKILFKLASFFIFVTIVQAQIQSPATLPVGELTTRTRAAMEELTLLEAKATADLDAFSHSEADLARAIADVEKPLPEYPLTLDKLDTTDSNHINTQLLAAETYAKAWEQRRVRRGAATQALARLEVLRDDLHQNYGPWLDRTEALRPLLIEAQRRIDRRDVKVSDFELPDDSPPIADWIAKSGEWVVQREAAMGKVRTMMERLEEDQKALAALPPADPKQARAVRRIQIGLSVMAEASAVAEEEHQRLANIREEVLPTEIERAVEELTARATDLKVTRQKVAAQREAFESVMAARQALQTPQRDDIEMSTELKAIRTARQDVELARRLIAYYEKDLAFQEDLRTKAEGLIEIFEVAATQHTAFTHQVALVWAILKHAETLKVTPDGISLAEVWASWRTAQIEAFEGIELNEQLGVLLADTSGQEADLISLEKEHENLRRAEASLQTEISYAEFMKEAEGLTQEALLTTLGQTGDITTQIHTWQAKNAELQAKVEEESQRCLSAIRTIQTLENPFSRVALRTHMDEFVQQRAGIDALKEGQIPPDLSDTLVSPQDVNQLSFPEALNDETTLSPVALTQKESDYLAGEQQFSRVFLDYFSNLTTSLNTLRDGLKKRRTLDATYEDSLVQLIQTEKRRYAAAHQLNQHIQREPLAPGQEPNDLALWLNRSALHAADELLRNTRTSNSLFYERVTEDIERLETLTRAQPWIKVRSEACNERVRLVGSPVSLLTSALTDLEALDDVDRQSLIYDARKMQTADDHFSTQFLLPFSPAAEQEHYLAPLNTYYLELANTGRVIRDLEAAKKAYNSMEKACAQERDDLQSIGPVFQETLTQRLFDYHTARHTVAVAKSPGQRERIEDLFRKTYDQSLPYGLNFKEGDVNEAVRALLSAQARLIGGRHLVDKTNLWLSKVGIDQEISWYGMQAVRIGSLLQGQENHKEELLQDIAGLRTSYEHYLKVTAARSLALALAIPMIAFVALRVLRRVVTRIETRLIGTEGETPVDRQRRVRTLTKTSTAAISVLIWILAVIYTFAQLGLDVTPIIASASVMGFALAFGAQTLVKDFFSGFFILIENQFTIGDIVALGDVSGTVEDISLRITVVRDLKGVVHYIPNGSIRQVSNKTQGWSRVVMEISVSHQENPDEAMRILNEVLQEMAQDATCAKDIIEDPSVAGVENMTERSIDIRIMIKTPPGRQWSVAREARRRIKNRFDEQGISIPFPHRVVHHVYEEKDESDQA